MLTLIDFIRSLPGKVMIILIAILTTCYFVTEQRSRSPRPTPIASLPNTEALSTDTAPKPTIVDRSSVFKPLQAVVKAVRPSSQEQKSRPEEPSPPPTTDPEDSVPALRPARVLIHAYAPSLSRADTATVDTEARTTKPQPITLPYGTMIACSLIHDVVATRQKAPIVAVTTEDIRSDNDTIIPEGTLMHGETGTITDDRLFAQNTWRFTSNGKDYTLTASLLAAGSDDEGAFQFGEAGLAGKRLDRPNRHSRRVFAATAISAASRSLKQTTNGIFGDVPSYSPTNAGIEATAAVADRHADQLLEDAKENQPRLAIASGATFYLYSTGTR